MFQEQAELPLVEIKIQKLTAAEQAIHDRGVRRSKDFLSAEASVLESVIEAEKARIYEKFGETYITTYIRKYWGLSNDVAGNFVRVARKSLEVPEIKDAIDDGKLSLSHARTIASVVTPENQDTWIDKAAALSKHELEKEVVRAAPRPVKKERARPVAENVNRLEMNLSDEYMAKQRRAQEIVSQKKRTFASLEITQQELLDSYLKHNDPVAKADRAAARKAKDQSRDCSENKQSHSHARKKKAANTHAVNHRDRGRCQVVMPDGTKCGQSTWTDHHHVKKLSEGGPDTPENLTTMCAAHHRQWHRNHDKS